MSRNVVVRVENVSKSYRIWRTPAGGFKGSMLAAMAGCLRGAVSARLHERAAGYFRDFPALRNLSFEVDAGECVGIIGRNGSGKSTLLQIVAGILRPSSGRVLVKGRVTSLLELGSGFNPDFSGRENVHLNGAILGIARPEMERKFDEIAAFADIGDFVDQPVKTYSSGMVMRLAFAVQVLLDPNVLIVDEALAVGDIFFRQKCYAYMRRLIDRGVAILFVTHDLGAVTQFCRRAIVLNRGECRFIGPADEGVKLYQILVQEESAGSELCRAAVVTGAANDLRESGTSRLGLVWPAEKAFINMTRRRQVSNEWARCTRAAMCDAQGIPCNVFEQGQTATFFFELETLRDLEAPSGGIGLQDKTGQTVHAKHSIQYGIEGPALVKRGSRLRYRQDIQLNLECGEYTYHIGFFQLPAGLVSSGLITVDDFAKHCTRILETERMGPFTVLLRRSFTGFQLTHWGIADLPGRSECQVIHVSPP